MVGQPVVLVGYERLAPGGNRASCAAMLARSKAATDAGAAAAPPATMGEVKAVHVVPRPADVEKSYRRELANERQ